LPNLVLTRWVSREQLARIVRNSLAEQNDGDAWLEASTPVSNGRVFL
jgi:hypothetical protein